MRFAWCENSLDKFYCLHNALRRRNYVASVIILSVLLYWERKFILENGPLKPRILAECCNWTRLINHAKNALCRIISRDLYLLYNLRALSLSQNGNESHFIDSVKLIFSSATQLHTITVKWLVWIFCDGLKSSCLKTWRRHLLSSWTMHRTSIQLKTSHPVL